ncbi:hypothetical protein FraQA3DRAFT_1368 [Frankia sp. QA3]|nr:hypothetical protein FraQA3DRAFT_1368 [Frankia sp. QA3]
MSPSRQWRIHGAADSRRGGFHARRIVARVTIPGAGAGVGTAAAQCAETGVPRARNPAGNTTPVGTSGGTLTVRSPSRRNLAAGAPARAIGREHADSPDPGRPPSPAQMTVRARSAWPDRATGICRISAISGTMPPCVQGDQRPGTGKWPSDRNNEPSHSEWKWTATRSDLPPVARVGVSAPAETHWIGPGPPGRCLFSVLHTGGWRVASARARTSSVPVAPARRLSAGHVRAQATVADRSLPCS